MRTCHVALIWDWFTGERYWQASTELDCLSPDAVYYTRVQANNKFEAIQQERRKHHGRKRKHVQGEPGRAATS